MSYFSPAEHAALTADPAYIATMWANHNVRFKSDLGFYFAAEIDENMKLGFCALVAYDHAPYGESRVVTLPELLAETHLDCDNYCALTWLLFSQLVPSPTITVFVIGVDFGPVGNHAFLATNKVADQYGRHGGYWIVDPTVALMLCGHGIDWLLGTHPCNMSYSKSFYWRSDINDFNVKVKTAMQLGQHKPTNILYFTRSFAKFADATPKSDWMTPASEGAI
jgi:hypothetical protein